MKINNCHGCKWLDEARTSASGKKLLPGEGYCSMVVRSVTYKPGDCIRTEKDRPCEYYKAGRYETRFEDEAL